MMRSSAKAAVEAVLVRSGVPALARMLAHADRIILAYHNVIEDSDPIPGDRSLHLPRSAFASQLERLARTHDVVPLGAMLEPDGGRRPRAAITFDDAYRGAVSVGVQELSRRGLPATIFVCPAFLGGHGFWWDEIAEADGSSISDVRREFFLEELRGDDATIRAWARDHGLRESPAPACARVASEPELTAAARVLGISLAAHGWSHANLARLRPPELEQELARPWQWLRERFPDAIPWLAYPYGRWSREVQHAALAAGYVAAVRVDGGGISGRTAEHHNLPRVNVPAGVSLDGFVLRLSGLRG